MAEIPTTSQTNSESFGPRTMSFFTLVLKSLAGFMGGAMGTLILLLILLVSSSILEPILQGRVDVTPSTISPLFIMVFMGMIFTTSLVASMMSTFLMSYTERERYTRVATTMGQVFLVNIVIFIFTLPVYLVTFGADLTLTAFTAGLHIILSATASSLILELLHDSHYPLLAVYETVLAILVAMALSLVFYAGTNNATIILFVALPMIWGLIGFFQAAVTMLYYWIFATWGTDYLATESQLGTDYGTPEEMTEPEREDIDGADFLEE